MKRLLTSEKIIEWISINKEIPKCIQCKSRSPGKNFMPNEIWIQKPNETKKINN
ncbi:MAG: hypothetical protein Q8M15_12745 [Bacteroidota bacterium]|nr:hypothetical protein [Bacteroidota bacterium]